VTPLWWAAGCALVFLGLNVNDPYMVPVQNWSAPALVAAGVAGLALVARRHRWPLVLLWAMVPLAVLGAEAIFHLRKARVMTAEPSEIAQLGRHFMVGYRRVEDIAPLATKGLIGGVFVTGRNLEGRSAQDLAQEIAGLQERRRKAGLPPLMVATDQEGGCVSHLSPWLPRRASLASVAEVPPDQRQAAARQLGRQHGDDLSAVGVSVNFAPVLDLRRSTERHWLDFRSLIYKRAISDDAEVVGQLGAAYAAGLAEHGIRATVKHFPGMGRITEDTHHFRARLDTPRDELEATDWRPFRATLSAVPTAMMMVGHITLDSIDPDRPASHSRRVVDGLLRKEWGFQGLVVTDDLTMTPIYQHGLCTAVSEALSAGVDLLLVAFDGKQFYRAMDCALEARRQGRLDPAMLDASDRRLRSAAVP
jgi:beta-N-acetylhexosaminidase